MSNELMEVVDVAVIGAGAAGVGIGVALQDFGIHRIAILEREFVGASFERWPREMRFLTPSFVSNQFGWLDHNAVCLGTSPAFTLRVEHPNGKEYARYLRAVAAHFALPVWEQVAVETINPLRAQDAGFEIVTDQGNVHARFVVWAAGEYQYPNLTPFPGAELCRHNSRVASWSEIAGDDFIVIGGSESGVDAAIHLARAGKKVRVLEKRPTWSENSSDPSAVLSPYTRERLNEVFKTNRIEFIAYAEALGVSPHGAGYRVFCNDNHKFDTPDPPILANGFSGSVTLVKELFARRKSGASPLLTEADESTVTPGVFLVGPLVSHEETRFSLIYQFRQRLAVVARQIALRLGLETAQMEMRYRRGGMFLDDLSLCEDECKC